MKQFQYQQIAVTDMTSKTIQALNLPGTRRKIVFKAPTGAGKTVMACMTLSALIDELKNTGESVYQECAFIWFAPRKLHLQSYESIKRNFEETRKLRPVMFDELEQSEGIQPSEILFINWESVNKDSNIMARESESSASLFEIARRTQEENNLPIVAIIDEEHMFWSKTADKTAKVLERINPKVEIRISATPKTPITGTTQLVLVDRNEVIRAEMIKKEVVLNPDIDVDAADPMSLEERLLKTSLDKLNAIAAEYERLGSSIKPLLLIQLPNDAKESMTAEDTAVADVVKTYLKYNPHEEITVENGKLAVWLAGEKENLKDLEKPDNMTKVLLFKEAIALGWDCPRAAVLLIFRKLSSNEFTIQTVGRIMRMPEQKHYPNDLLNIGYVYTDIAKDKIEIVTADQNYILKNTLVSTRRAELHNVSLPSVYASRPNSMHNYLGPDFKKVFYDTAAEFWRLEQGASLFSIAELAALSGDNDTIVPLTETDDLTINENRKRVANQIRLDVKTVNVEIPKDVHFQNEVQTLSVEKAKFARTANEIDRVFLAYINTKGGQFESRQGDRTNRIAGYVLGMLEDYFGIFGTDAKKVVLYHVNRDKFDRLIDLALDKYMRRRSQAKSKAKRIMTEYEWQVPEERVYDAETNHFETDMKNHALSPFVQLNVASSPEKKFEAFLEQHTNKIDWWYKNGDAGRMHYAIPYEKAEEDHPLFYPDFIVRMKSGSVYILDTKTANSDTDAPAKHNALIDYICAENAKGNNLRGGILIQPHNAQYWLYSPMKIDNTSDLSGWDMFDPNHA